MADAATKALRTAAKALKREVDRAQRDADRTGKKFHKRKVKEMVKAAKRGEEATGLSKLPEAKAAAKADSALARAKDKLAKVTALLPRKKKRSE